MWVTNILLHELLVLLAIQKNNEIRFHRKAGCSEACPAECNVDGNFFAKPACQPLLLLHGGQAFFHGRKESGVNSCTNFWFFCLVSFYRTTTQKNKQVL